MSNFSTGSTSIVINNTDVVQDTSCSTSYLSSLFASFLTGGGSVEMGYQKYFVLYEGEAQELRDAYEPECLMSRMPEALIDRIAVRSSSTSRDLDGNYYATFLGTFNGSPPYIKDEHKKPLALALVSGDMILAFAPFDVEVYREVVEGSRVEIKWKLQLKHVTTVIREVKEEKDN